MRKPKPGGPNTVQLSVYCTREEKKAIESRAKQAGMSVSQYLKQVSLGIQPRSVVDSEEMGKAMKAAADLGRLGGLLKWWLSGSAPVLKTAWGKEVRVGPDVIRSLLARIESAANEIKKSAQKFVRTAIEENGQ